MSAFPRRAIWCLLAVALAVVVGGCGADKHPTDATAENNGYYVRLGGISYQLQVSRELNKFATEDHQYLVGVPASVKPPRPNELWYGVFLRAMNEGKHARSVTTRFDIVDTEGTKYYPVPLNPSINQFAWTGATLQPQGTEPAPDTTASYAPTQGGLLLFKLNTSVYDNRPLTLEIHVPGVTQEGTISLDL